MKVNIASGQIQNGSIYEVAISGSITYNSVEYSDGQTFTGTSTTTYSITSGSPEIYQVLILQSLSIENFIPQDEIVYPERVNVFQISVEEVLETSYSDKLYLWGITIEEELYAGGQVIWMS